MDSHPSCSPVQANPDSRAFSAATVHSLPGMCSCLKDSSEDQVRTGRSRSHPGTSGTRGTILEGPSSPGWLRVSRPGSSGRRGIRVGRSGRRGKAHGSRSTLRRSPERLTIRRGSFGGRSSSRSSLRGRHELPRSPRGSLAISSVRSDLAPDNGSSTTRIAVSSSFQRMARDGQGNE